MGRLEVAGLVISVFDCDHTLPITKNGDLALGRHKINRE